MRPDDSNLAPFIERMRAAGLSELAILHFAHYYGALRQGATGFIAESDISAVTELPAAWELAPSFTEVGHQALPRAVMLRLNGGLGTSMGLLGPKSLLPVKEGLTFLEIMSRSSRRLGIPLILMNSFATRAPTLQALASLRRPDDPLPPDFLQHQVPKVDQRTLSPVSWPKEPALEWCPPGHGDLYPALMSAGLLDQLLRAGIEYAFVANGDNLGASLDPAILGYLVTEALPFLMEVTRRTPMDQKGGHLARQADGRLILREIAQCPPEDRPAFEDISRHRFFNTNNLWLHLPTLRDLLYDNEGVLGLPLIVNAKTVDPRDPQSTPIFQLETAMGAALSVIPGAGAIQVDRARYAPVKTTAGLLAIRSDAYVLTEDFRIVENAARPPGLGPLEVRLDPACYGLIDQLDAAFPHGPPSLLGCELLEIQGAVRFGRGVRCQGRVRLAHEGAEPLVIADETLLQGEQAPAAHSRP